MLPTSRQISTVPPSFSSRTTARDIIGADLAVFETSDLNPNVVLEMGVALTWGMRVLLIKRGGCEKPPSDISGQTWADYEESARKFLDRDHGVKLIEMIKRAVRKDVLRSKPTGIERR